MRSPYIALHRVNRNESLEVFTDSLAYVLAAISPPLFCEDSAISGEDCTEPVSRISYWQRDAAMFVLARLRIYAKTTKFLLQVVKLLNGCHNRFGLLTTNPQEPESSGGIHLIWAQARVNRLLFALIHIG